MSALVIHVARFSPRSLPQSRLPIHAPKAKRCFAAAVSKSLTEQDLHDFEQNQADLRQSLRQDAAFLTKALYRTCLRSVRVIRPGNDHDELEFQRLEEDIKRDEMDDQKREMEIKSGVFSMTPPVDRDDELRSRGDYYHQFTWEQFHQESDCLFALDESMYGGRRSKLLNRLDGRDVDRFLFLLEKGNQDRQWLLQDMQFSDPYSNSFPKERAEDFKAKAYDYIRKSDLLQRYQQGMPINWEAQNRVVETDSDDEDEEDDDDEEEEEPAWFKEKFPHIVSKHDN
ncbi:expressed unknown protein [Seminavis robusta]|uniref:Uncharacterized protein n=1 Tax=Seminavis robusta TaxID=568900 RepID=A0A9N8EF85_9STRA|nr:expressed unknown protein [Seminavis robusta]|eukprot:Sro1008_g230520.1 n/a (284) ;mRNA; r:12897-13748